MSKYLIINADDFGINQGTNEVIEELFELDLITNTSIMTGGEAYEAAADRVLRNDKINAGLHFTMNSDSDQFRFKAFTSSALSDTSGFFKLSVPKGVTDEEVANELQAQLQVLPFKPVHIDNHNGTVYGFGGKSFLPICFNIAGQLGVPFRYPSSLDFVKLQDESLISGHENLVRYASSLHLSLPNHVLRCELSVEALGAYGYLEAFYLNLVDIIPEGISELFMHPSKDFPDSPAAWKKRVWEYELLKSGKFHRKLKEKDIILISYKDIEKYEK